MNLSSLRKSTHYPVSVILQLHRSYKVKVKVLYHTMQIALLPVIGHYAHKWTDH